MNTNKYFKHYPGVGAPKGNTNSKGHTKSKKTVYRFIYTCDGIDFGLSELANYLGCSKSTITESFRKNYGLVAKGLITRRPWRKD